jgi:hypothetical protein
MAAITPIRNRDRGGRAYHDRKIAEGKTHKGELRSLKRQISNAIHVCPQADPPPAADDRHAATARARGPGGQLGNGSDSSAASSHPRH